ncbi:methyl-accepting chemotaxis protein 4 [Anaerotignum neopropionicum]|uniref:Methyl-accepting chemotaxis protein 4 n=1 Tax=Anaerotignum neopropionicum TaxID=36847 RepID=A0A136WCA2_9FIRM|nr:methyl-accepting chemotaxis protein [Anaerotignum neopropionicum]KXL52066.1 methyl-accepting chemotaxis protein 4 [Anaerotignum neopropionicum]
MGKYRIIVTHLVCILILAGLHFINEITLYRVISILTLIFTGIVGQFFYNTNTKKLKTRINKLSQELSAASGSIKSVSAEIQLTVNESDVFSKHLFQQSTQVTHQMTEVNQIIAEAVFAIKNLVSLSSATKEMASELDATSRASAQTISNSKTEILNIVDVIGQIKDTSTKAVKSMETLKETSDSISGMLREITTILAKMKLISINASIEAARAGEAGRGFTVVAAEFKSLSQMTDEFVKGIETQIFSMNSDVVDVYDNITQNNENVSNGVAFSKTIEHDLENMSQSFHTVIDMVEKINHISCEQSAISDQVGNQIGSMEALVNTTSQNADKVYHSALQQKDRVENISQMSNKLSAASQELSEMAESSIELPAYLTSQAFTAALNKTAQQFFVFIQEEIIANTEFLTNDPVAHNKMLQAFMQNHENMVEAVWTNDVNGRFFSSIPPASIANAKIREWFISSVRGEQYISNIYVSGITKNPCVTLAVPYHSQGGEIIGVVGLDINLNGLSLKGAKLK